MSQIERRMAATVLEVRDDDANGVTLTGYASTFDDPYDMGWYEERVETGAFKRTLGRKPDVRLLINHTGLPLARTTSSTLTLDTDKRGLMVSAQLDPSDPDVQRILPKMRRGDLNQMSFAFRIDGDEGDEWSDDFSSRTLRSLDLNNGDVSVVTYPANPNASAGLRAAGTAAEPIASALATLEGRGATDAEVVEVLTRALAHFRRDDLSPADPVDQYESTLPTEQEPRDIAELLKARARRLALLG